ncbi:11004_t:CDS:2, partial [Paraglomus brasilianum]
MVQTISGKLAEDKVEEKLNAKSRGHLEVNYRATDLYPVTNGAYFPELGTIPTETISLRQAALSQSFLALGVTVRLAVLMQILTALLTAI